MPTLRWLTREDDVKAADAVPYRLLEEVPELSYGERDTGNMLIQGDNLDALKALLPYYAGQVRCIYIDPPYNTGSAFEQYEDNLEHSKWLSMMVPRLQLLRELLASDGTIWISIDDREAHYLKVIMDEVFGRKNFISNVVWQKAYGPRSNAKLISDSHEHILLYAKNAEQASLGLVERSALQTAKYKNPDDDPRGPWKPENSSISLLSGQRGRQYAKTGKSDNIFEIIAPNGKAHLPPENRCWAFSPKKYEGLKKENRIWFGKDGTGRPSIKRYLNEITQGVLPQTLWRHEEVGHNQNASREIRALFGNDPFPTPKPEALIERIIKLASNPYDIILDSFLGSGTTGAVAQKLNRKFIGIELGDHAVSHCQVRLVKVTNGEQGGISKTVDWQGGGGFRFFKLGLSVFDETGQIKPNIEFSTLAAHIWFYEVGLPWDKPETLIPILGKHESNAYALLYNGILGDKRVNGGNVLTRQTLRIIRTAMDDKALPIVIYGERSALSESSLKRENITFKQTPYDVKARA